MMEGRSQPFWGWKEERDSRGAPKVVVEGEEEGRDEGGDFFFFRIVL